VSTKKNKKVYRKKYNSIQKIFDIEKIICFYIVSSQKKPKEKNLWTLLSNNNYTFIAPSLNGR
jgi:hypothetical protein